MTARQPDVILFEVGPRDGLQNEKKIIPTHDKVELVDRLSRCGFTRIEVTAFVSARWVPQMADSARVMAGIERVPSVSYAVLAPNLRGYEAARLAKADATAIFISASEGFSKANVNCTIAQSLERCAEIAFAAREDGVPLRGYVSCITDCPFDGPTPPENVARAVGALRKLGCYEVSLGDTIGKGRPETIDRVLDAALGEIEASQLAGHFHDTNGWALQNIAASIERGLRVFDTSIAGLGGCPYAPGAVGNVSTERVLDFLTQKGYFTGIDTAALQRTSAFARSLVSKTGISETDPEKK